MHIVHAPERSSSHLYGAGRAYPWIISVKFLIMTGHQFTFQASTKAT